jgi:hypothetical protein
MHKPLNLPHTTLITIRRKPPLYYTFRYFCKMNCEDDKFIYFPSFSFNEVKQLLVQAQIIIVNS